MNDFLGVINLWQLDRLPKGAEFKYSLTRSEESKYFNTLDSAIKFASIN